MQWECSCIELEWYKLYLNISLPVYKNLPCLLVVELEIIVLFFGSIPLQHSPPIPHLPPSWTQQMELEGSCFSDPESPGSMRCQSWEGPVSSCPFYFTHYIPEPRPPPWWRSRTDSWSYNASTPQEGRWFKKTQQVIEVTLRQVSVFWSLLLTSYWLEWNRGWN